ncbi:MAG: ABC transporter ATP-binding protein [Clostridia bacterium]|nr:ABC transporter ATP-binding protein [Clostridia bacterium]
MREYYPLLFVGAVIGVFSIVFAVAYAMMKDKKTAIGFERNMKDGEIIRRLLKYARPYVWNFVLVGVVMLLSISYDILSPLIISDIEELITSEFEMKDILIRVGVYASILIVSLVSMYVQAIVLQKTGQKIISALREDLFTHIESLSHNQLHQTPVGKLVTRVTNDTGSISIMFTHILVNLIKNIFVIIGVLAAMLLLNYALTLMILCFVPFIVLFTVIFRKFSRRAYRRVKDGTTDINTFLSENLSGMKIIQIFNREEKKKRDFDKKNRTLGRAKEQEIFVFGVFRPMVYMLYISTVLCLFYLGAKGHIQQTSFMGQTIDAATVVAFYMYINKFFNPIQNLAEQFNRLQSAFASGEKIFTIFDIVPEVVDEPDAIELETVEGNIEFRDVWFSYVPDEWVLKGVSFKINAKETVAFVGSTGSGKTTILSLICRNYDIQKGQILIDGIDIRKIKISSLRRHFGQMLQDVFLFSGTIRSNIVLRDESITDEEVMQVCRYVNADHFINKLTRGLDEEVRERGNNFSAGQRQLLSFARTMAHKPSVMILDEATANIDTETELLIQDSLEKMMNVGTMLMVAHRLSTIKHADQIIVLSHGEIVERGSHAELLEQHGKYYHLYTLQYHREQLGGKA